MLLLDRKALDEFTLTPVLPQLVDYLIATTQLVVQVPAVSGPAAHPLLATFVGRLCLHLNVQTPTLMATLCLLVRLRSALPAGTVGMATTQHRVFLGCLIVAAKTCNDLLPLNKHWTQYTDGLLTQAEVNAMEREVIGHLGWQVLVTCDELIACHQPFLRPICKRMAELQSRVLRVLNANARRDVLKPVPALPRDGEENMPRTSTQNSIFSNALAGLMLTAPTVMSVLLLRSRRVMKSAALTDLVALYASPVSPKESSSEFQCRPLRLSRMSHTPTKIKVPPRLHRMLLLQIS